LGRTTDAVRSQDIDDNLFTVNPVKIKQESEEF
jgi:hypothetical protein